MVNYKPGLRTCCALAALTIASSAYAQDQQPVEGGSAEAEAIVVTGSRIVRRDYVAESPIVTVGSDTLQVSGQATVGEALNQLPQLTPASTSTSFGGAELNGNAGQTNPDLRGLGSRRTLTLLDGRRLQPSDLFNAIDLNNIPASLIVRTELITGGASAVYGSDALAGVINFHTRRDFSGLEIDTQTGITSRGDGRDFSVAATFGVNSGDGRANLVLSASYYHRDGIHPQASRPFFLDAPGGTILPGGGAAVSGNNLPNPAAVAAVFARYGTPSPLFTSTLYFNPDGTLLSGRGGFNARPFPGVRYGMDNGFLTFQFEDFQQLQLPLERYTAFARGRYELSEDIEAFAQLNYSTFDTEAEGFGAFFYPGISVPASNPFIPADFREILNSRPNPAASFLYVGYANPYPNRTRQRNQVWQFQTGLRGKLPGDWTWDAYVATGRTERTTSYFNIFSRTNFNRLINAPDGGRSLCAGGLNLFPFLGISQQCQDYLLRTPQSVIELKQDIAEANIQGGLFSLPGGSARVAFGAAYRSNQFDFNPDPMLLDATGDGLIEALGLGGGITAPASGKVSVKEAYAEVLLPLLADMPLMHRLELSGAYRYSDYNLIGGVSTYKVSGTWEPFSGLLVRGSYQRAIRAPAIGELFAPSSVSSASIGSPATGGGDPCAITSSFRTGPNAASVRQLCVAQGVPLSIIDTYNTSSAGVPTLVSGNTGLKEETSDSYSFGAVLNPRLGGAFNQISLSVDYFNIKIRDAIGIIPGSNALRACFNASGENPTYSSSNIYCANITRDQTGNFYSIGTPTINLGSYQTSGVDVQFDWRLGLDALGASGDSGAFSLNVLATYLDTYKILNFPGAPFLDYAGTIGQGALSGISHPRWRTTSTLAYELGGARVGVRARHIGKMSNSGNVGTTLTLPGVPDIVYLDLFANIRVNDQFSFRGGVSNVGDRMPPFFTGNAQTDLATYDVIGRRFHVGLTAKF